MLVDPFGLIVTNTVDFTDHPDLFPITGNQKNIVTIKLQGDRKADFVQAFKVAGINKDNATGYTWHHVADFNVKTGESTMQLIKRTTHEANVPHKGSVGQFADHFGVEYDTFESKQKAYDLGYREKAPKQRVKKIKCE